MNVAADEQGQEKQGKKDFLGQILQMDYFTHTHCCTVKTSFDILPHQAGICDRRVHSGMGLQSEIKTIWAVFVSVCGAFSARLSSFIRGETAMIFSPRFTGLCVRLNYIFHVGKP